MGGGRDVRGTEEGIRAGINSSTHEHKTEILTENDYCVREAQRRRNYALPRGSVQPQLIVESGRGMRKDDGNAV